MASEQRFQAVAPHLAPGQGRVQAPPTTAMGRFQAQMDR
jgi:hypothetical protein